MISSRNSSSTTSSMRGDLNDGLYTPPVRRSRPEIHHELSPLRIKKLLVGLEGLMQLPDPIAPCPGNSRKVRESCSSAPVSVCDVPVPLGIVGIFSRYRPRVTLDAIAMFIQSGNAVLIDGGVSVRNTNRAVMSSVGRSLAAVDISSSAVIFVDTNVTETEATSVWLGASEDIDLGIVCGTEKLYQFACKQAAIPLIRASGRPCSLYVDKSADYDTALKLILNAKFRRPASTNAIHNIILHESYPRLKELLAALKNSGARLLGDSVAKELAPDYIGELHSSDEYNGIREDFIDFHRVLCVKTVPDINQAIYFLECFGSRQSDGVIATDEDAIRKFSQCVDSAVVLINTSTRLSSGSAMGRGTDIAIATSKVHSRGPLTLSSLTTRKIIVRCDNSGGAWRLQK